MDPSPDALPPGARLAEYEILAVLTEAESGIVYLGMDHGLQRQVAIKEYLPAALASRVGGAMVTPRTDRHAETFARGLQSFVDEARLLARFDHPALMRVYRFWEANGTAYMVTPHYEGPTLAAAREAMERPPSEAWLRDLLLPLLGALDVLHGAACHDRDVSPENILLLPDGRPVLLDSGVARPVDDERTQAVKVVLEPAFAPIELYAESATLRRGPWTNLYSLAAVAYYCVSGQPPVASTVRALDDQMEPLSQLVDRLGRNFPELDYSVAFVSAIERALRVRPQERPRSVSEFRRALLGGRGDAEVAVPPTVASGDAHAGWPPLSSRGDATAGSASRAQTVPEWDMRTGSPPPEEAPHGIADDAALRHALDAVLRPDPDDFGGPPHPIGANNAATKEDKPSRKVFMGVAAAALIVLAAGGGIMWAEYRAGNTLPQSTALGIDPGARPTPVPSPAEEPPDLSAVPSGAAAESGLPPPGAATPVAPVLGGETPQADAPSEVSAPASAAAAGKAAGAAPPEAVAKAPNNPRVLCGPRTHFALYRCMKEACEWPKYYGHAECRYLRATDEVRALP